MLKLAIVFFIISVIAGALGFTNIAAGAQKIAKVFFFIFLVLFLIVLVFGVMLGMLVFLTPASFFICLAPEQIISPTHQPVEEQQAVEMVDLVLHRTSFI